MISLQKILWRTTILALLICGADAGATDIETTTGLIYRDATVVRADAEGLQVRYSEGVVRIPFEQLSPEIQKKYNYDAVAVAAQRAAEAERLRQEAETKRIIQETAQREEAASQQREIELAAQKERESRAVAEAKRLEQEESARQKATAETVTAIVGFIFIVGLLAAALTFYFLPAYIGRRKRNAQAIFVLNFVAGWTFAGWVIALVWACTKDSAVEQAFEERRNPKMPAKNAAVGNEKIVLPR